MDKGSCETELKELIRRNGVLLRLGRFDVVTVVSNGG